MGLIVLTSKYQQSITHYQRSANQNHNEVLCAFSHWSELLSSKSLQTKMLERVWRKGNALKLLVGMETDMTTMENSMEIALKTRNKTVETGHISSIYWAYTLRKPELKQTHVPQCSLQHY